MTSETDARKRSSKIINMFGARRVFVFYLICLVVTAGTLVASIIMSLLPTTNTIEKMLEHVFLCAGGLLLLSIPVVMHRKYDFRIPWFINMTIAFLILAHFVLGEIYRFYDHVFLFDKFLHLTGGLVIAACGFSIVYGFNKGDGGFMKLSPFFAGLFSFCFALALLVLWEVFEYYVDTLGGFNMQRWRSGLAQIDVDGVKQLVRIEIDGVMHFKTKVKQGSGLVDTMNDLIIGTIGAAAVSIIGGFWFKKKPDHTEFLIVRNKAFDKAD